MESKVGTEILDPRFRTFFIKEEKLLHDEGETIEYKNYFFPLEHELIKTLQNTICSFLNASGGRIYIGVNDDKIVKGIFFEEKQRDLERNYLTNLTKTFYPSCRNNNIKVVFLPIKDEWNSYIRNLWVIKIIVKKGDSNRLYSTIRDGFKCYMRLPGQTVVLSANEIEEEMARRFSKPYEPVEEGLFKDFEPEIPIYDDVAVKFTEQNYHIVSKVEEESAAVSTNRILASNLPILERLDRLKRMRASEQTKASKVRISNLPLGTKKEEILQMFSQYHLVFCEEMKIIMDKGADAITAEVNFVDVEEANRVKTDFLGLLYKEHFLYVSII